MEEDSSGQSQPAALSEEPVGEPNDSGMLTVRETAVSEETAGEPNGSSMLTVRETDDQEMGLAVAILELIGSQPHIQVGTFGKCCIFKSLNPSYRSINVKYQM